MNNKYTVALPFMSPKQSEKYVRQAETINFLDEVKAEVDAQFVRWGEQNHADFVPPGEVVTATRAEMLETFAQAFRSADVARNLVEEMSKRGWLTYAAILREEIAEAMEEAADGNEEKLITELKQCAAVIASWVGSIRRRQRNRWADAVLVDDGSKAGEAREHLDKSSSALAETALLLAGVTSKDGLKFGGVEMQLVGFEEMASKPPVHMNFGCAYPRDYFQIEDYQKTFVTERHRTWNRKPTTRVIELDSLASFNDAKVKSGDVVVTTKPCNCGYCNGRFSAAYICDDAILTAEYDTMGEMKQAVAGTDAWRDVPALVLNKSKAH
jgi:hypothetical protein